MDLRRGDRGLRRLADEDLMALVRRDRHAAFEVVYERHADAAFALAYRILGQRARAEDAVQEAFVSLWRSRERYDPVRGSVRAWVLGVARNRAIDVLRRSAHHEGRLTGEPPSEERLEAPERTDAEVTSRDERRRVRAALDGLPSEQLQVMDLAYFGGFSQSEIAEIVGAPLGTVKGRMRLALTKMRSELATAGLEP